MAGYSTTFATALLGKLGYPATAANLQFMAAWAQAEGGTATNNPFNTTEGATGATNYNSVGVKNYTSFEQGVTATAETLQNGDYAGILNGLKSGASAMATAQAVAASPWGTGGGVVRVLGGTPVAATPGGTGALDPGSAAAVTAQPAPTVVDQATLSTDFPIVAGLFSAIPELKTWMQGLLNSGVDLSTDEGKEQAQQALYNTTWYKTTSNQQRTWQTLQTENPGEAKAELAAGIAGIAAKAGAMGVTLTAAQESTLATQQLSLGLNDTQIQASLGAMLKSTPTAAYGGTAAGDLAQLQSTAGDYGVPVSQGILQQWVSKIESGLDTTDGFTNYVKGQAKLMYPGLATQIDQGTTVRQVADTYVQTESQLLEVNADSLDFTKDPLLKQALQYRAPVAPSGRPSAATAGTSTSSPTSGGSTAALAANTAASQAATASAPATMPMYQFELAVKNSPQWLATDNARDAALTTAQSIGKAWGFSS